MSRHALTVRARRRSFRSMSCSTPLLPRNRNRTTRPVHLDVRVAHRRQPERLVLFRVLVVADADERLLEQLHDRGEHLLARQVGRPEIPRRAPADRGQRLGEPDQAIVFRFVADLRATWGDSDTASGRGHRVPSPGDARGDPAQIQTSVQAGGITRRSDAGELVPAANHSVHAARRSESQTRAAPGGCPAGRRWCNEARPLWRNPRGAASAVNSMVRAMAVVRWMLLPEGLRLMKCPACGSTRVFPSRLRNILERLRQMLTEKQPYRCHQCELAQVARGLGPPRQPRRASGRPSNRPGVRSRFPRTISISLDIAAQRNQPITLVPWLLSSAPCGVQPGSNLRPEHQPQDGLVAPNPFGDAVRPQIPIVESARGLPDHR